MFHTVRNLTIAGIAGISLFLIAPEVSPTNQAHAFNQFDDWDDDGSWYYGGYRPYYQRGYYYRGYPRYYGYYDPYSYYSGYSGFSGYHYPGYRYPYYGGRHALWGPHHSLQIGPLHFDWR